VLVNATMDFGLVVLLSAGLSYVGLGAVPPTPEWGLSINEGTLHFEQWWVAAGPGIAILSIVLAFNFLGDGLRDYLDVRMR
jgi:peptide/nickel transport system permease protein